MDSSTNIKPDRTTDESAQTNARITNLDTIRGFAVLGILVMNAVSYGLHPAAYFNLDAGGSKTWLDWVIGSGGEIFIDQKTMGLFSILFGAGIVLFADRVEAKGGRPLRLSLWRNALLLVIGAFHGLLWDGDILVVYAICSPIVLALRHLRPKLLLASGAAFVLLSAVVAAVVQTTIPADGQGLGDYWLTNGSSMSDAVGLFLLTDFFARALGMMLLGVALYRMSILDGKRSKQLYRNMAIYGLAIGVPIAAIGLAIQIGSDFGSNIAVIGEAPNTIATIPLTLGYLGVISLWNRRATGLWPARIQAVGRMALTNYLTQTILGIAILRGVYDSDQLSRTSIAGFVLAVWALQIAWSKPWLDRFRYGPLEWAWRSATYRRWQPLQKAKLAKPGQA